MKYQAIESKMPGTAKKKNTSRQPQTEMITAHRGGTMTGPNFTADRKIPEAMPFSRGGNQLLIVVVMLIGSGPSARPRPRR
ncbi:hypothetical protein D3C80_1269050 [compost metagenome]